MKKKGIALFVAFCLIAALFPLSYQKTEAATTSVTYKYNGKNYTYKGATRYVTVDGKNVSLTSVPAILLSNNNMAPYYEVLVKSSIKAKKSYSSKTKILTITYGENKIKMTMGSKTAYVNNKKVTLPVAPRNIKYKKSGKSRIIVPIKAVCKYLGLTYSWTSSSKRMFITTPEVDSTSSTNASASGSTTAAADDNVLPGYTIRLARPSSVAKGDITATDDYDNKRLKITMKGDQTTFYAQNAPVNTGSAKITVSYSASSGKTTLYFKTSSINGFIVKEDDNYIYIKNGKPQNIFKHVIVLDAGHGGSDSGAVGNGYKEKNFTLSIVKAAKEYFDDNSNYKVYYTRLSDTYPSLSDRYNLANNVDADIFVSVHINSAGSTATGTETLYNPDRNKSQNGLTCYQLAKKVQSKVQAATGFSNRGLKQRCSRLGNGLAVLNHNDGPATLTEIGFISNKSEAKKMAANLNSYGKAVYNAIVAAAE
ncbi:MAG: N-acetylmuramoyl-L-alanine amidase [Lachnospiraceae bacterium]|nr:N-acetylmuramoyl-L-alanine amidase [Lachnospiraceae bacterium]